MEHRTEAQREKEHHASEANTSKGTLQTSLMLRVRAIDAWVRRTIPRAALKLAQLEVQAKSKSDASVAVLSQAKQVCTQVGQLLLCSGIAEY